MKGQYIILSELVAIIWILFWENHFEKHENTFGALEILFKVDGRICSF